MKKKRPRPGRARPRERTKPSPVRAEETPPVPEAEAVAPPAEPALPRQMELLSERDRVKAVVEALLLAADRPLSAPRMAELMGGADPVVVRELLAELEKDYVRMGRAFTVAQVAEGFQLATRAEFAPWVRKLFKARTLARLTRSSLETLAVVAYRQPATRAEIEGVRGVNIETVLQTLLERRLIRIVGRKDVPGRPLMYGTTLEFLQYFGLKNLSDLPQLREIGALAGEERALQELLPFDLSELREDQRSSRALLSLVERRALDLDASNLERPAVSSVERPASRNGEPSGGDA